MDSRIVRINANQTGKFTNNNNVISVTLDSDQVVNMKDSYFEILARVETVDAEPTRGEGVYNFQVVYGGEDKNPVYNTALIRNCRIVSANQGILEEINDVNVLNNNINSFMASRDSKLCRQYKSLFQVYNAGELKYNIFRDFNGEGSVDSRNKVARIPIKLSSLFGLGVIEELDIRKTGELRLEIELDIENISVEFVECQRLACKEVIGNGNAIKSVFLSNPVVNLEDIDLWVGQKVECDTGTISTPGAPATKLAQTISEIELVADPAGGSTILNTVKVTFDYAPFVLASAQKCTPTLQGVGEQFKTIDTPTLTNTISIEFDQVELVVHQLLDGSPRQSEIMYLTYDTENANGNKNTRYQDQFILPPNCVNALWCFRNANADTLQSINDDINEYRVRVDNINQTDRPVEFSTSFYYEQLVKYALNNDSDIKDLGPSIDASEDNILTAQDDDDLEVVLIPVTVPATPMNKIVQLQINGTGNGVQNIACFKQIQKVL